MKRELLVGCLICLMPLSALAEDLTSCMRGWDSTQSGDYAGALTLYESCIKEGDLSPASLARTYRNIGITYRRAKQPLKAVEAYGKAIALNPADVVDDYINRGNAFDEADEFDKAMADYSKALSIRPGFGEVYYNRGVAYEHHKMLDEAKADFLSAYQNGLRTQLLYQRFVVYGLLDKVQ